MTEVQVEDLSTVKKKITFQVPEEKFLETVDVQYKDLQKNAQIRGFRRGKVPLNVLRSFFKAKVEADAVKKIIEDTFESSLEERNIKPVHIIRIEPEALETGKPFTFTAEVEVPPQLEITDYKGMKLKKLLAVVKEEDVAKRLEALRERHGRLSPIAENSGVREGDMLRVDVEAEADGAPLRDLTVTDYHVHLGKDYFLPGFDAHIHGLKTDESKEFSETFPEDFPRTALRGKTVNFKVTIRDAKERVLPELDDDFAKELGEYETIEALKEEIRNDLAKMYEDMASGRMRNEVIDQLIEKHPFEVPDSLVERQIDAMIEESVRRYESMGIDPKKMRLTAESRREQVRPSAVRGVKGSLILKAVADQEGLEISKEELRKGISERLAALGVDTELPEMELDNLNEDEWADFRGSLMEKKVFELIEDNADVTVEEPPAEAEAQPSESEKE